MVAEPQTLMDGAQLMGDETFMDATSSLSSIEILHRFRFDVFAVLL
jgi:hypothetical protein